ncbi:MAG: LamG domain-containing protein, partial [Planctomycetota bacterium]|nr:LamG domain-containing protein [Planctomycetota bacterium]
MKDEKTEDKTVEGWVKDASRATDEVPTSSVASRLPIRNSPRTGAIHNSQTLTHALISIVLLFLVALVIYALIFTWELDPATQGGYTTQPGMDAYITVTASSNIAELIRLNPISYTHNISGTSSTSFSSSYSSGGYIDGYIYGYSRSGYALVNTGIADATDFVRLATHPNGGYWSSGDFTSRIMDNTQTWNGLVWRDGRIMIDSGESGLVALWRLNNGVTCEKGNATTNPGSLVTFASPANGVLNECGTFNGTDAYVSSTDNANLQFGSGAFSVESWVYLSLSKNQTIVQKINYSATANLNTGWELRVNSANNPVFIILWDDDSDTVITHTLTAGVVLDNNKWYHIAGTRQGTIMRVYINGQERGVLSIDAAANVSSGTGSSAVVEIGRISTPTADRYFNGRIDEVGLYNRAISADEIKSRYERGLGLKFQIRAWTSGSPPAFEGPAGAGTYYTSAITTTGTNPSVSFSKTERYFQYKAFFETAVSYATPKFHCITATGTSNNYEDNSQTLFWQGETNQTAVNTDYIRLLTTYTGAAREGTEPGMTALWHMNEQAGEDAVAEHNPPPGNKTDNGTRGNSGLGDANEPTQTSSGKFSYGLDFDGRNDFVRMPSSTDLAQKESISIETWITPYANADLKRWGWQSIINKPGSYRLGFDPEGTLSFELFNDGFIPLDTYIKDAGFDTVNDPHDTEVAKVFCVYNNRLYLGHGCGAGKARLYYWDGQSWTEDAAFYTKTTNIYEHIRCMAVYNGKLYVGMGDTAGDADVLVYDSATGLWDFARGGTATTADISGIATPVCEYVSSMCVYDGKLFVGTGATAGDADIYVYDGTTWYVPGVTAGWKAAGAAGRTAATQSIDYDTVGSTTAATYGSIFSLCVYNGKLYAGAGTGLLGAAAGGTTGTADIFVWDGTDWRVAAGTTSNSYDIATSATYPASLEKVNAMTVYKGKLYAATGSSSTDANVFVYDGTNWQVSFSNTDTARYDMFCLQSYGGKLYAGAGRARNNAAATTARLYVFNGTSWSTAVASFGTNVQYVASMGVYNDKLWVGVGGARPGSYLDMGDVYYYGGDSSNPHQRLSYSQTWSPQWYHISAGYDKTKLFLAINGTLVAQKSASLIISPNTEPLFLGGQIVGGGGYTNSGDCFRGIMDEVAVYDRNIVGYRTQGGSYESPVIDAGKKVKWDKISWGEENRYGDELEPAISEKGLIGLWHLNSDFSDSSGNNKNAVKMGDVITSTGTIDTSVKFGSAMGVFAGGSGDYLKVENPGYTWGAGITVEAWIKTGLQKSQSIVAKGLYDIGSPGKEFQLAIAANYKPSFRISTNGEDWTDKAYGPSIVTNNSWNHIVGVYDGAKILVYVNGDPGSPVYYSGQVNSSTYDLWIGNDEEVLWSFTGYMDEVVVYNRPLPANEVLSHYLMGACSLKLQVRTDDDNSGWMNYGGPDASQEYYTIGSGQTISPTIAENRYIQYKVSFGTEAGLYTPRFDFGRVRQDYSYYSGAPWVMNTVSQTYSAPICAFTQTTTANSWGLPTT